MEHIERIVKALALGHASSEKGIPNDEIKEAYTILKELIIEHFKVKGIADGEIVLKNFEKKPDVWESPIKELLLESEADQNNEIAQATQYLYEKSSTQDVAPLHIWKKITFGLKKSLKSESKTIEASFKKMVILY